MVNQDKVEVIDLIINVLKDHERSLDTLVSRVEHSLDEKPSKSASRNHKTPSSTVTIVLKRWTDFKERCHRADLVAFDYQDCVFQVSALKNLDVFYYREAVPELMVKMREDGEDLVLSGVSLKNLEENPSLLSGRLQIGLSLTSRKVEVETSEGRKARKIVHELDPDETRDWLSEQLEVNKKAVIYGRLEL